VSLLPPPTSNVIDRHRGGLATQCNVHRFELDDFATQFKLEASSLKDRPRPANELCGHR
jgi:hypothetical protein